jgi:hypothetical protein
MKQRVSRCEGGRGAEKNKRTFGERTLKGRCGVVVGDFAFDFVCAGELMGGIGGGGYFSAYPASAILNAKIVTAVTSAHKPPIRKTPTP